ncbi:2Fe-2S iron-sulfur cluster-binding protein [Variovorax guangxiensis]|uniref:2Fe-2S iron-sulfur cluster-binding protein n=1 Tax=Variovorax guangxiensis TaxID=1775474 RepID=UPI002861378C|nr:2Fe-2S iron-sulfur cluster-binding protein [Variovorax guangxiensis]MDR6856541.1 ferredoxin [Variovorax guangxiensis]
MSRGAPQTTAQIEPGGLRFETEAGRTLLESAESAGIELPSSCRNGTCRTCICRLLDGEVRFRIEWPGLSREEKAEGWILPCVAEPVGDVRLDVPLAFSHF